MKTILLTLALLPSFCLAQDTWAGEDKKLHFAFSAMAGVGCAQIFREGFAKPFACAMIPGVIKEIADSKTEGNKFSGKDMVANALGAAIGVHGGKWLLRRHNGVTTIAYRMEF